MCGVNVYEKVTGTCAVVHMYVCKYTMEAIVQLPMLFLRNHWSCFWTQGLSVS